MRGKKIRINVGFLLVTVSLFVFTGSFKILNHLNDLKWWFWMSLNDWHYVKEDPKYGIPIQQINFKKDASWKVLSFDVNRLPFYVDKNYLLYYDPEVSQVLIGASKNEAVKFLKEKQINQIFVPKCFTRIFFDNSILHELINDEQVIKTDEDNEFYTSYIVFQ